MAPRPTGAVRALSILACVWLILAASSSADDRSLFGGAPIRPTYPNPITFLDNGAFVVGYDEVRRVPAWVAYRLFPNPGTFAFPRPGSRCQGRTGEPPHQPRAPPGSPLISRQSPWLVASISWRAPRAQDRYAGHNEYKIPATRRIAVQSAKRRSPVTSGPKKAGRSRPQNRPHRSYRLHEAKYLRRQPPSP